MRHKKAHKTLGRGSSHRKALLRNLSTSFLEKGQIETTLSRAKQLKPVVESLITKAKKQTLAHRRQLSSYLFGNEAAHKTYNELGKRFESRPGGYTRILKLGPRLGDGAEICKLQLVDYQEHEGKILQEQKEKANSKAEEKTEQDTKNNA